MRFGAFRPPPPPPAHAGVETIVSSTGICSVLICVTTASTLDQSYAGSSEFRACTGRRFAICDQKIVKRKTWGASAWMSGVTAALLPRIWALSSMPSRNGVAAASPSSCRRCRRPRRRRRRRVRRRGSARRRRAYGGSRSHHPSDEVGAGRSVEQQPAGPRQARCAAPSRAAPARARCRGAAAAGR